MAPDNNDASLPTLLSIRDFAKKHPFMSENSLRWLLFKNTPGLEQCLIRVSRRIYINEAKFFTFLSQQGGQSRQPLGNKK